MTTLFRYFKLSYLVIFCVAYSASFGTLIAQDNEYALGDLEKRINDYYNLEKKKDWENTYKFRVPIFVKSVPFDIYKSTMERDSKGWRMLNFEVKSIKMENELAFVEIIFKEKCPKSFPPEFLKKEGFTVSEGTLWELIDGSWYVRNPGGRQHFTLNIDLVTK